ncbi:MAG: hypothetical protein IPG80_08560 [Anaerolineales bacterium]|uniref:hypothetical protein n=1 Tax=Candidatus Villigracilis vicinus TaxID=3140679 RepID=UPI00313720D4|nr:hypothetical protein [Anaerolineales bacterium]
MKKLFLLLLVLLTACSPQVTPLPTQPTTETPTRSVPTPGKSISTPEPACEHKRSDSGATHVHAGG